MTTGLAGAALLMLDYQVGLCEAGDGCLAPPLAAEIRRRGTISAASSLLAVARDASALIVHVRLAFDPTYELRTNRTARFDRYAKDNLLQLASPEAQFVDAVAPSPGEPIVSKGCVSPFIGTSLRDLLAAHSIDTVVMAGVATNLVVESAARHAADSGLNAVVVENACASFSPEMHEFAVKNTLPLFASVVTSAAELA